MWQGARCRHRTTVGIVLKMAVCHPGGREYAAELLLPENRSLVCEMGPWSAYLPQIVAVAD